MQREKCPIEAHFDVLVIDLLVSLLQKTGMWSCGVGLNMGSLVLAQLKIKEFQMLCCFETPDLPILKT